MRPYWETRSAILEARSFKAVPEGYIFQPPPPTIFEHTDAYVVTEAQKAQILAITRSPPPWWRVARKTILALSAGIGVCLCVVAGAPVLAGSFLALEIWFLLFIVISVLSLKLELRKLQPLLAGLPPSGERLWRSKRSGMNSASGDRSLKGAAISEECAMSYRRTILVAICFGVISIASLGLAYDGSGGHAWLWLALAPLTAISSVYHFYAAHRQRHNNAGGTVE
jgi:hypothetical protein